MSRYAILIEPTETGFSAYSPDLPGCVSTGHTIAEAGENMRAAVGRVAGSTADDGSRVR